MKTIISNSLIQYQVTDLGWFILELISWYIAIKWLFRTRVDNISQYKLSKNHVWKVLHHADTFILFIINRGNFYLRFSINWCRLTLCRFKKKIKWFMSSTFWHILPIPTFLLPVKGFTPYSRIVHSYWVFTVTSEGPPKFWHSWPLSRGVTKTRNGKRNGKENGMKRKYAMRYS